MAEVREWVSQYIVNATPADADQYNYLWDVTVDRRVQIDGEVWWAVRWSGRRLHRRTDEWDHEPIPSSRPENWLRDHSYPLMADAVLAAHRAAPEVTVNGLKAKDVPPRSARPDWSKHNAALMAQAMRDRGTNEGEQSK